MTKKGIDLEVFKNLSQKDQLDVLHREGVYVGKQILDGKSIILYQLNHFYAEVHYREYRREVEEVLISKDIDMLLPYLSQVSVRDLDKNQE